LKFCWEFLVLSPVLRNSRTIA